MADTKISALTAATSVATSDTVVIVQGGVTKKAAVSLLPAGSGGGTSVTQQTRAPTPTDDTTAGYTIGTYWLNTSTGTMYYARAVTASAAAWERVGISRHPGYIAGRTYAFDGMRFYTDGSQSASFAVGTIYAFYVTIHERITIGALGATIIGGATAGATMQMALYKVDPTTKLPSVLMGNTGSIDCSTTGKKFATMAATTQVEAGVYAVCAMFSNATPATVTTDAADSSQAAAFGAVTNTDALGSLRGMTFGGQTYGTWPATLAGVTNNPNYGNMTAIVFTVTSVP